ncbi:molybdenum cofactor guanylyltransferase [Rhizobium sp. RU20A]|uniref:molybdenum cofactor guanylyltransferase MobA n=1 Tax=Rhizobium sp. RU20A TaxID=1907412 RepID=UPI0009546BA2|nr:molybdenum cofactor guanylyltransferase MobA [Rhizobium sp. RU20A]SIQ14043.1 molybdenum cofactor guanylyltransferase [Rhizobium sp. RU20A]
MSGKHTIPAVVLAGGLSRRMGTDKATVLLAGRPLLAHILARLAPQASPLAINRPDMTGIAPPADPHELAPHHLPDRIVGRPGPLAGVHAAMLFAREIGAPSILTTPIDAPFIPIDLAARLAAARDTAADPDRTVIVSESAGRLHPVAALWPAALVESLADFVATDEKRRVTGFLAGLDTVTVAFPVTETPAGPLDPFFNINTPEDLATAARLLPYT